MGEFFAYSCTKVGSHNGLRRAVVPIGESVSARSSFKSVQRNRLSFDSAVPKIGPSEDQDFKGPHPLLLAQYRAEKKSFSADQKAIKQEVTNSKPRANYLSLSCACIIFGSRKWTDAIDL